MKLSKLQTEIIENSAPRAVVMAAAASGKTRTLTEKARSLLRQGVDPRTMAIITFTNMAAAELRKRLDTDYKDGMFIGTIHSLANQMLVTHGIDTSKLINDEDFDKLFSMLEVHPECVRHYRWVLLDEAQDSGEEEFQFVLGLIDPENFWFFGDVRQCQPRGTKILMADKTEKNIEDIQIGDNIMSYNMSSGMVCGGTAYNATKNIVENIQKRQLSSEEYLIKVTLDNDMITYYTPNHRAISNLCRYDEYNYLTYLMCDDNNRFRVGTSQLRNSNSTPWREKLRAEECKKIWILQTFKTNKEARVLEDKISYKYQIPQITFQLDKTTYTKDDVDYIYEGLDTYTSAIQCLKDFNRDINYPFSQIGDNIHYAGNAFNTCYACNLLPNNMKMKVYSEKSASHSKTISIDIRSIEYIYGINEVYSLQVSPHGTYIGDGIVTHNSIYGFKGARPDLLLGIMRRQDVKVFDMNENYRNGYNILEFARRIIRPNGLNDSSIAMRFGENGIVKELTFSFHTIVELIQKEPSYKDWAVLVRTNNELSDVATVLKKANIPYDTFRQGDLKLGELEERMAQNKVKVLTIHSAKGLEWNNVIVVGARFWNDEERNVCYVAATRARNQLYWMTEQKKQYKKMNRW